MDALPSAPTPSLNRSPADAGALKQRFWLGVLIASILLLWFGTLGTRHLLSSDEGRYAEIAREMWISGDWITPRYNDLQYFEKPPLHLWMTAAAYQLFGAGEWQARWWGAFSGLLGLLLTMLAAHRWWGRRVALSTGLILLATPSWYLGSHFNSLDISVSGALAAVLAATLIAQHPDADVSTRRRWMLLAWAAMAVAILTKGLIGLVLPGLVLVLYSLICRDWRLWGRLHIAAGAPLLLVLTVPWFWAVAERHPAFLHFFFIHEHLQRYTTTVHHRTAPWWYFVPQLIVGFLPWLGLLPAMWRTARATGSATSLASHPGPGATAPSRTFHPTRLIGLWAGAIVVFFSASSSKLPGYILPVLPALALLAGVAIDQVSTRAWRRWLMAMLVVFGLGAVLAPWAGHFVSARAPRDLFAVFGLWAAAGCLLMAAGAAVGLALMYRDRPLASRLAYAIGIYLGVIVTLQGHEAFGRPASGVDLVPAIERVLTPQMPLYGVKKLDHTMPFYLRHPLVMVEEPDELAFGVGQEPTRWLPTMAAFKDQWQHGPHALALMSPDTYQSLRAEGLPMWLVAQDQRRVVVANAPLKP